LFGNQVLTGWQIYPLPMEDVAALAYKTRTCSGACFYQATFEVGDPADTFVDTSAFGKGEVFINGQPLGRFWNIGPQRTLYLPAPWVKAGKDEIVIFDLNGEPQRTARFLDHAELGDPEK